MAEVVSTQESSSNERTRFKITDWYGSNKHHYNSAEEYCNLAEKIVAKSKRVCEETEDITQVNKAEVDQRFKERIEVIEFRKEELEKKKADCCREEEALLVYKDRLTDALQSLQGQPLNVCKKCIAIRENRLGIDLVHDDVDCELQKELQMIEGALELMHRVLEQIKEQIRLLRSSKYFIDRDHEGKVNALNVENHCICLRQASLILGDYSGPPPMDPGNLTLEEWEDISRKNIKRAAEVINNSRPLRSYVDMLLKQVTEDFLKQYCCTNKAFNRRIEETRVAKSTLEIQHYETLRNANEIICSISKLESAIAEKKDYLTLTQTRIAKRTQRPAVEQTRDEVERRLVMEMQELNSSILKLQGMLEEAHTTLRYLVKVQLQLEENINVKTNSLKIDEVDCMTLRQNMDYHAY